MRVSNWIISPLFDFIFFLSLPFFIILFVLVYPINIDSDIFSPYVWIFAVVGVDVSHVYSTLFRTYWDKEVWKQHKAFLLFLPFLLWLIGIFVYSIHALFFWRLLAYIAVYHFIKQQIGFLKIYQRSDDRSSILVQSEILVVYIITITSMVYWHVTPDRAFQWFVQDDFLLFNIPILSTLCFWIPLILFFVYLISVIYEFLKTKRINYPTLLLIIGTGISWYLGIVVFNSDVVFTLLNVLPHGIPYIALIAVVLYRKQKKGVVYNWVRLLFKYSWAPLFIIILVFFAYVEEWIWDAFVWNEHSIVFPSVSFKAPSFFKSEKFYVWIIPLLSLPQFTHYILDGYIWKNHKDEYSWKRYLLD